MTRTAAVELFTEEQVEKLWKIPIETLRWWRKIEQGPAFVRLGPKTVRYSAVALEDFVQSNTHIPTVRATIEAKRVSI